jgi:hypothetical protein
MADLTTEEFDALAQSLGGLRVVHTGFGTAAPTAGCASSFRYLVNEFGGAS